MPIIFRPPPRKLRLLLVVVAAVMLYGVTTQVVWYAQSRPSSGDEVQRAEVTQRVMQRRGGTTGRRCRAMGANGSHGCRKQVGVRFRAEDGSTGESRVSTRLAVGTDVHVFRDDDGDWRVVEGHTRATTIFQVVAGSVLIVAVCLLAWRFPSRRGAGRRARRTA